MNLHNIPLGQAPPLPPKCGRHSQRPLTATERRRQRSVECKAILPLQYDFSRGCCFHGLLSYSRFLHCTYSPCRVLGCTYTATHIQNNDTWLSGSFAVKNNNNSFAGTLAFFCEPSSCTLLFPLRDFDCLWAWAWTSPFVTPRWLRRDGLGGHPASVLVGDSKGD